MNIAEGASPRAGPTGPTSSYDVHIYREGGTTKEMHCVRPIAVSLGPDTGTKRRADITKAVAEAKRHSVAAPFLQLIADLPAWSMRIQVSPLDARFTQLESLDKNTALLSGPLHWGYPLAIAGVTVAIIGLSALITYRRDFG